MGADLRTTAGALLTLALVLLAGQAAALEVQDPGTFVVDTAQVLTPATAAELEGWLLELEQKTTAQVKLLTVPTLAGDDLFEFTQRQFRAWKLGQTKKNNGVLIVLALAERKIRIHTGYGLEGALPDSWCGTLERQIAAEYFRRGDYNDGLRELTIAVVRQVAAEYGVTISGVPAARFAPPAHDGGSTTANVVLALVLLTIVLLVVYANSRNSGQPGSRARGGGPYGSPWIGSGWPGGGGSSAGGGGWSGGGGSWGGGGGSFGGGGSSGGGGAQTGW